MPSNGRRELMRHLGWISRRRKEPTCRRSRYARRTLRGIRIAPESESNTIPSPLSSPFKATKRRSVSTSLQTAIGRLRWKPRSRPRGLAATAPIRLVQEKAGQNGILLIFPVRGGSNGAGVLLVAQRMATVLDGLLAPFHSMVAVRLTDLEAQGLIYSSRFVLVRYNSERSSQPRLRHAGTVRHRHRNGTGGAGASVRAIFHDQGSGSGVWARLISGVRVCQAERWHRIDR